MKYTLLSVAAMATTFTAKAIDSEGPIYYTESQPIWPWVVIISILAAALIIWVIYLLFNRRNANPANANNQPVPIPAQVPAPTHYVPATPAPVPVQYAPAVAQAAPVVQQTQPVNPVQNTGIATVFTIHTATPIQVGPTSVVVTT